MARQARSGRRCDRPSYPPQPVLFAVQLVFDPSRGSALVMEMDLPSALGTTVRIPTCLPPRM